MSETTRITDIDNVHLIRGVPAAVAGRIGFDIIQLFRTDALTHAPGYRRHSDAEIAQFVDRTTETNWHNPNRDTDMLTGQRRWDPQVAFALDDEEVPLAYWYTARNVSSSAERSLSRHGFGGPLPSTVGMIERGIKRVIAPQRTYVWTREYAALPGYEHLISRVGAVALNTYPEELPGTIYPFIPEDDAAAQTELPRFGFKPDSTGAWIVDFTDDRTSYQNRWVVPTVGLAVQNMLLDAEIDEVPSAELVNA